MTADRAPVPPAGEEVRARVGALHRCRPRSRFLRISLLALAALTAWSWTSGAVDVGDLLQERRAGNLHRFLTEEAVPLPIREHGFTWERLAQWAGGVVADRGARGLAATLWISVLAIVLAGVVGAALAPFGARNLMRADPFLPRGREAGLATRAARGGWRALSAATRTACILLRAIPEYVWAFLLLAMLGPGAWPAVLALAIHNAGILGRLGSDTVENLGPGAPRALRMLGARRAQLLAYAVLPMTLPRLLLYFFYRYETCVREATVVGMLGVVSLGWFIQDARARLRYDELLLFVALGGALVFAADVASNVARRWVRDAA